MIMEEATTTIRIRVSTKEKLDEIGDKGDTYDELVLMLIAEHKGKVKK